MTINLTKIQELCDIYGNFDFNDEDFDYYNLAKCVPEMLEWIKTVRALLEKDMESDTQWDYSDIGTIKRLLSELSE